jgi:hypothetical protein
MNGRDLEKDDLVVMAVLHWKFLLKKIYIETYIAFSVKKNVTESTEENY